MSNKSKEVLLLEEYLEDSTNSLINSKDELYRYKKAARELLKDEIIIGTTLVGTMSIGIWLMTQDVTLLGATLESGSIAGLAGFYGVVLKDNGTKKYVKQTKERVKNLTLLNRSIEEELDIELQKEKSKEISNKNVLNTTIKTKNSANELLDEYLSNRKEIKREYFSNDEVKLDEYGPIENRIFTRMIKKEMEPFQKKLSK